MSTQAIRNNITNSIRRVITDVKRKVQTEGKKKVMEMKDQLLSPDTIIMILQADINAGVRTDKRIYWWKE